MINLLTLSPEHPYWVEEEEYNLLQAKKQRGWSHCDDQKEWLVKLHYLRKGFKEGKLNTLEFQKKEAELILHWWRRWCP